MLKKENQELKEHYHYRTNKEKLLEKRALKYKKEKELIMLLYIRKDNKNGNTN